MNMPTEPNEDPAELPDALARRGIDLPAEQVEALTRYCSLLWETNRQLNLTRHTTCDKFVARDLVDTMELAKLIDEKERVLDVGTGGGVPGVPLVIMRADLKVSLAESVAKRALAVQRIVAELDLPVRVYHRRAEDLLEELKFDTLIVRAVAPLTKLLTWFAPRWNSIGRLLVVKGPSWIDERADARHRGLLKRLQLRKLASYPLPDSDNESVILQVSQKRN